MRIASALLGFVDRLALDDGQASLSGWVADLDTPLTEAAIEVNGEDWGRVALEYRPDVERAYPDVPHAARSGFEVRRNISGAAGREAEVRIRPRPRPRAVTAVLSTRFVAPEREAAVCPLPPPELQKRVGGAEGFLAAGWNGYRLIKESVERYRPWSEGLPVLDWGCGCGRLVRYAVRELPAGEVHGCDIDVPAVEWARQVLPQAQLEAVRAWPPTPYAAEQFGTVYGLSVMTHLDEATQLQWLEEIRRITRRGGLVVLSVISSLLRNTLMPARLLERYHRTGFAEMTASESGWFAPFSSRSYYKTAFHSIEYVWRTWGRYFELLEYVRTGHQDLVVMRR